MMEPATTSLFPPLAPPLSRVSPAELYPTPPPPRVKGAVPVLTPLFSNCYVINTITTHTHQIGPTNTHSHTHTHINTRVYIISIQYTEYIVHFIVYTL